MKTFFCLLMSLSFTVTALAVPDYEHLAADMYPQKAQEQDFVTKFFEILELQKTKDPFFKGRGPSIQGYSLDKIRFAFMTNETDSTVDLVIFNWGLSTFNGLIKDNDLSSIYGSDVYILKNVLKKSIATQGKNHDQLTNYSYIQGADFVEQNFKLDYPDVALPENFINFKIHPDFMDRSHPLRKALGPNIMALLSPSEDIFFKSIGFDQETKEKLGAKVLEMNGGFYRSQMGVMIHEMFHMKESNDIVTRKSQKRKIPEDRKYFLEQLTADKNLKDAIVSYLRIIFSIAERMKATDISSEEKILLSDLNVVINEIKTKYPNAWNYIWSYEYTEGFAEYTAAFSMIQGGIVTLPQEIDRQIHTKAANFAYRTGTLGGLYLSSHFKAMPFSNNEDQRESVWQIIIRMNKVAPSTQSYSDILAKYQTVNVDQDYEIQKVVDYLVRTSSGL